MIPIQPARTTRPRQSHGNGAKNSNTKSGSEFIAPIQRHYKQFNLCCRTLYIYSAAEMSKMEWKKQMVSQSGGSFWPWKRRRNSEKSNKEERGFFNPAEDIGRTQQAAPPSAIETATRRSKPSAGSGTSTGGGPEPTWWQGRGSSCGPHSSEAIRRG